MKKIDLYEIAIKILGLYLIVIIINQLRDVLVYLTVWVQQKDNLEMSGGFDPTLALLAIILGFLTLIALSSLLIFRTKRIAKLISSRTDREEELKLHISRKSIFEICLVLLGLVTLVLALPDFIFKLKNHINLVQSNLSPKDYDTTSFITSGMKIGIGVIAIIFSAQLSTLLTKKGETDGPNQ